MKRIGDLLRQFGIVLVLREIISWLDNAKDENLEMLRDDLETALREYERRGKGGKPRNPRDPGDDEEFDRMRRRAKRNRK